RSGEQISASPSRGARGERGPRRRVPERRHSGGCRRLGRRRTGKRRDSQGRGRRMLVSLARRATGGAVHRMAEVGRPVLLWLILVSLLSPVTASSRPSALDQLSESRRGPLEEHGEVLGEQHALVEDDLAACDAPLTVNLAQQVLTLTDEEICLGLDAVAIDEKAALDAGLPRRKAGRARLQELHVRDHVTDPGWRLLCP